MRAQAAPAGGDASPWATGGATAASAARGFTLIEVMAVVAIMSAMLLLLPPSLDGFGDRTRLDSSTNTMVAVFTGAREQAVIDGHEVIVQLELGDLRSRQNTGHFRYRFTTQTHEAPKGLDKNAASQPSSKPTAQTEEDEWIETGWRGFPNGVILAGYSETAGQWVKTTESGRPLEVHFLPDGVVRPAFAVRLQSLDLASDVPHVTTVLVNALTSTATVVDGEGELPVKRDASDFHY